MKKSLFLCPGWGKAVAKMQEMARFGDSPILRFGDF